MTASFQTSPALSMGGRAGGPNSVAFPDPSATETPAPAQPGAGTRPRVIGLDLSLTATGMAHDTGMQLIRCDHLRGTERFTWIENRIIDDGATQAADLVVVEGPAYSRAFQAGHHEAAGLWWHIIYRLDLIEVPYAVVSPSVLKKYATGRGNATKPDMRMALYQRAGIDIRDDNQVDAFWLRAMGLDHLGHPLVDLPKAQRTALTKVTWPERATA